MQHIVSMPTDLEEELMPYEHMCHTKSYARRRGAQRDAGTDERFVTRGNGARAGRVRGPLRVRASGGHLQASGLKPAFFCLLFFAAGKEK
jgi:hypothetical protein